MIVKQVSVDIEVDDGDIDFTTMINDFIESKGFTVMGVDQIDISEPYNKICTNKETILNEEVITND
jgi:predicted methyltransferase